MSGGQDEAFLEYLGKILKEISNFHMQMPFVIEEYLSFVYKLGRIIHCKRPIPIYF